MKIAMCLCKVTKNMRNMSNIISTLVAIAVVIGAFFWGRSTTPNPQIEVITTVDTIRFTDIISDTIFHTEYVTKYLTSTDTIEVTKVDSVLVYVPISTHIFQDSTYRAEVSGYEVNLKSIEFYNTNTTTILHPTPKHWFVNIGINSFTTQEYTSIALGAGVEYRTNRWSVGGDYRVKTDGSSGIALAAKYSILNF